MKADCNINTKELGSIVNEMLADKNQFGREAFKHMMGETEVADGEITENEAKSIEDVVNHVYGVIVDAAKNGDERVMRDAIKSAIWFGQTNPQAR